MGYPSGRRRPLGRHGAFAVPDPTRGAGERVPPSDLRGEEVTGIDGIPITTVARTLLDLAAYVPPHHLRRAAERAGELELFDLGAVQRALSAHPRWPGRGVLATLLEELAGHAGERTRSDVEAAFLQLCDDYGLPRPQVNAMHAGAERDFTWPEHRVIVEVDGYAFHRSRRAFANDRARDRAATIAGYRVVRFTAIEVLANPAAVAAELQAILWPPTASARR